MKFLKIAVLGAALAAATAMAADDHPSVKRAFSLPPSADLTYAVKASSHGLPLAGTGTVSWRQEEGKYSLTTEARSGLFGKVLEHRSEGAIDDFGLAPASYYEKRIRKEATTTTFRREEAVIGFQGSEKSYPIKGGEQDRSSAPWQLAAIARKSPFGRRDRAGLPPEARAADAAGLHGAVPRRFRWRADPPAGAARTGRRHRHFVVLARRHQHQAGLPDPRKPGNRAAAPALARPAGLGRAGNAVYRVTPMARNVLSALDTLLSMGQADDEAEMGFLLSQVAGAQAVGGVTVEQLKHLLGRLVDLTEEFRDAIASGSEFRLRTSQAKWHMACDWVEKGSRDPARHHQRRTRRRRHPQGGAGHRPRPERAAEHAGHVLARAEPDRAPARAPGPVGPVDHRRQALAAGARGPGLAGRRRDRPSGGAAVRHPGRNDRRRRNRAAGERNACHRAAGLPAGQDAPLTVNDAPPMQAELDDWLARLSDFANLGNFPSMAEEAPKSVPIQDSLLPASFAVASYRASLLPLLGDAAEASLQGATAEAGAPADHLHADRRHGAAERSASGGDVDRHPLT
jgi:hypothetical protein